LFFSKKYFFFKGFTVVFPKNNFFLPKIIILLVLLLALKILGWGDEPIPASKKHIIFLLCLFFKKKRPFQHACGDEEEVHIRKKLKIQNELYEKENVGLKDANKQLQSRITLLKNMMIGQKNLFLGYCCFFSRMWDINSRVFTWSIIFETALRRLEYVLKIFE
jgi:hypothetical protein